MTRNLTVVDHPLIRHKLTLMRDKGTPAAAFRQLLREISLLPAYEVLRDLPTTTKAIETPLGPMDAPILGAGNGLPDGMLDLAPSARVGHIGPVPRSRDTVGRLVLPQDAGRTGRAARHCRRSDAGDGQLGFGGTRQAQGRRRRGTSGSSAYITAPVCHGTNSLSPRPSASLLVLSPDATAIILSRISRPFCSIETPPSAISPQLISMSSVMLA